MPVTNNNDNVFPSSMQPDPVHGSSNTGNTMCVFNTYLDLIKLSDILSVLLATESLTNKSNYVLTICLPSVFCLSGIFCLVWGWCLLLKKKSVLKTKTGLLLTCNAALDVLKGKWYCMKQTPLLLKEVAINKLIQCATSLHVASQRLQWEQVHVNVSQILDTFKCVFTVLHICQGKLLKLWEAAFEATTKNSRKLCRYMSSCTQTYGMCCVKYQ